MKNYLLLILLFITTNSIADNFKLKIYYEKIEGGYNIYADNDEFCPMSIKIEFTVLNLNIEGGNNNIYVANARKKKQLLTSVTVKEMGKAYKMSYQTWTNYGDHNKIDFDEDYVYNLPYIKSKKFKIHQGYNGTFSHQNENSLDFSMPVGTKLTAVREGTVVKVIKKNNKNCGDEECQKYNNLILIHHSDGTFAEYAHIKQNGARVRAGLKVKKGQLIGYSGNVGWSTGPHLHLVIFKQKIEGRETLKTKFKTGNGDIVEYLEEKNEYTRGY